MDKYYKAYENRYKMIHNEQKSAWAGDTPSFVLKDFLQKNNISKSTPILEIGCGEGQNAIYLMQNGYNIFATDVSHEAIRWCKNKARESKLDENAFAVLDIINNEFKTKYDIILSISTLHMLVTDEDRKSFFDFIYEHLTDKGIAYISVMGDGVLEKMSDINKAFDIADRQFKGRSVKVVETTCRIVNWQNLLNEVARSNLKVINKYISKEIAGFASSMIVEVCK